MTAGNGLVSALSARPPQPQQPACLPARVEPQPFNPITIESTRKRNRTSLPQGTARERELLRLSKLSDGDLSSRNDEEILGKQ